MTSRHRLAILALTALTALSAQARKVSEYDVLASSPPAAPAVRSRASATQLLRPGSELQVHERFGVPTFFWASQQGSAAGLAALRARLPASAAAGPPAAIGAEDAARAHLGTYAGLYGLSAADVSFATVAHVHDLGRGAVIVQLQQRIDGVEVFREQARVVMTRDRELVAISGFLASAEPASFAPQGAVQFVAGDAVAAAFSDLSGQVVSASAFESQGALEGGYEALDLVQALKGSAGATTQPARVKPVWFHSTDGLLPAWYVEVDTSAAGETDSYSYVISASDGSILFRHNLTQTDALHAYTYRVYASDPSDPENPGHPWDGPQGNLFDPHPTGALDGTQPGGTVPQTDMTIVSSPYLKDPWLPVGAVDTTGNNVEAYVDLVAGQGFTYGSADFHADLVSGNSFARTYDPAQPNAVNQQKAALLQMFYNVNFFHDWYYGSGFTEAAGNAQTSNYGRGGVQGDNVLAEGQDYSGRNNANMTTPADGGHPRMQMFLFDGIGDRHLYMTGAPSPDYATGLPSGWGVASHDLTGDVVRVNDGVGGASYPPATTSDKTVWDGCDYTAGAGGAIDPQWATVAGKIAFIDRGGTFTAPATSCGFVDKAFNAQRAGAIGVVIANVTPHGAATFETGMAGASTPQITIPAYQLGTVDADAIRAALLAGVPVTARMLRTAVPDRDGTMDNQIMAHEWGHYISNRLVGNSSGLTTNMASGMGEGYADFHALLLTVKEEDASVPYNAAYNGVYGLTVWVAAGGSNGPAKNQGVYFGIRRMPYSTDLSKNSETYRNIQDDSPVPTTAPFSSWPAPGTPSAGNGNSEVHHTGEVWATMLWECYAGILRGTVGQSPRLGFTEARDRMKDYLVAGYKATPSQPTFLEARDAILSVIYAAGDTADYQACLQGFARRGAGIGAVSPDRYSATNDGVVESYATGNQLTFVGAAIADDIVSCDRDSVLDSGETGTLTVTLRNDSALSLGATTATVTTTNPDVTFPNGATLTFVDSNPLDTVSASLQIALSAGLTGIQHLDLSITPRDPQLPVQTQASWSRRGNYDDVAAQSATDDVESASPVFTTLTLGNVEGLTTWWQQENSAYDHSYKVADQAVLTDLALVSPNLAVGPGAFSVSFQHRYSFETSGGSLWDGAVVEIATDGGNTWTDIGSLATGQAYTGALSNGTPLGTRRAFGGLSPGYPSYVSTTINLGTTYAGTTAKIRFRAASDASGRNDGWEIDNIAFSGIANLPFPALLPNKCTGTQTNRRPTASIGPAAAQPERSTATLTGMVADADADAVTLHWTQVRGPAVTLVADAANRTVSFTAPEVPGAGGSVTIGLIAFDGTASSALSTRAVSISHVDRPPVVSAGSPQTVNEGTLVQLSGAATDPDGDAVTWVWTQLAGPAATLSSASAAAPTFIAPEVNAAGATLTFQLAATANAVAVNATVDVTVRNVNRPPVASTGKDLLATAGGFVALDASSSSDPDGDTLTCAWTQLSGPAVTLTDPATATPRFVAPAVDATTVLGFQVTVSDGRGGSSTNRTYVTVAPRPAPRSSGGCTSGGEATLLPALAGLLAAWSMRRRR